MFFNKEEKINKQMELLKKQEHEANLEMLMGQWNIANSIKDDAKRAKHTARLSQWIEKVEAELSYSNDRLSKAV